jgi:hypothetical protein
MDVFCPDCISSINAGSINIDTGLGKCENCGSVHVTGDFINFSDEKLKDSKLLLPAGSKITFNKTGNSPAEFILPPAGLTGRSIPFIIFSSIWLILLIFWTIISLHENLTYTIFSIPFWIAAFWIFIQTINSFWEKQIINLDKQYITLKKVRPVRSKEFKIGTEEIIYIRLENFRLNGAFGSRYWGTNENSFHENHSLVPVISYGSNKESFFENSSAAEQRWIACTLNRIIYKLKNEGCF